jgi:superfamily II DNA or RNA helicase
MITKLCAYEPRTIFISRVVKDLISEDVSKQIMILCHNRSLLTSLFEKISQGGFASVGYYVGGMKQKDLQETETKQIVLATYAMAAEALDIKTLSTLIMVTPKTDITQSVGRILRVKHENPVIVDIIDQHEPFQKQWLQRKRFYKKCNYLIKQATNIKYENMSLDWKQDNDVWKTVYDPKNPTKKSKSKKNENDEDDDNNESKKCLIDVSLFDFGD